MSVPEPTEPGSILPICLEATQVTGLKTSIIWRVELHPDRMALSSPEMPDPLVFPRVDLANKVQYIDGMAFFLVKFPQEIQLRLKPEDVATFWKWWSPPTRENLQRVLKQKLGYGLPIGIMFLLMALADTASLDSRVFTGVLGLLTLGMWAMARYRPHPIIFAIDAVWFITLSCGLIIRIARGGSWFWLILVLSNIWLISRDIKNYRYYSQRADK